nr:hypothetical protein [Streptomyces rubellomurinus]
MADEDRVARAAGRGPVAPPAGYVGGCGGGEVPVVLDLKVCHRGVDADAGNAEPDRRRVPTRRRVAGQRPRGALAGRGLGRVGRHRQDADVGGRDHSGLRVLEQSCGSRSR